jgi:hypothetical protein
MPLLSIDFAYGFVFPPSLSRFYFITDVWAVDHSFIHTFIHSSEALLPFDVPRHLSQIPNRTHRQ